MIVLAGCVPIPKKEQQGRLQTDISMNQTLAKAFESQEDFEKGNWPAEEWWQMFTDQQLNGLIHLALKDNPSLKRAEVQITQAMEEAKRERALLFPEMDITAQSNWQYLGKNSFYRSLAPSVPANVNQIDLDLNLTYEYYHRIASLQKIPDS